MKHFDSSPRPARGPRFVVDERRSRHRLRDLCEEVLASYRAARGIDVVAESDRREARELLARIVPNGRA
jgi:hypothetical protein